MKFKKLIEEFAGSTKELECFINPNKSEWKDIIPWSRGFVSIDTNDFIITTHKEIVHEYLWKKIYILPNVQKIFGNNSDFYNLVHNLKIMPVQRKENTNEIYLSEMYNEEGYKQYIIGMNDIFFNVNQKNPLLKFVFKTIEYD